jgi:hypothetical protein
LANNASKDKRSSLFRDIIDDEEKRYVSLATDQVTITLIISLKEVRLHLQTLRRKTQKNFLRHRPLAYLGLAASGSIRANSIFCIGSIMSSTATFAVAGGFAATTARVNAP